MPERSSDPVGTKQVQSYNLTNLSLLILTIVQTLRVDEPATMSRAASTASAPPVIFSGVAAAEVTETEEKKSSKKYAKTLRLTSDQLKQLDLKPGANTITFSLTASGVAACTARIFVWDNSDSIVVSDIDGTITK